jgi:hypothetical protein
MPEGKTGWHATPHATPALNPNPNPGVTMYGVHWLTAVRLRVLGAQGCALRGQQAFWQQELPRFGYELGAMTEMSLELFALLHGNGTVMLGTGPDMQRGLDHYRNYEMNPVGQVRRLGLGATEKWPLNEAQRPHFRGIQANCRTHRPQKLKCLISLCTNPVSILSVPIRTVH